MNTYDTIVIGADSEGLTTAAYLAKAGQRVAVIDGRCAAGGPAVTEEVFPGFRFEIGAHDAGWLSPQIARDLDLAKHGLAFLDSEAVIFAPTPDGGHLTLWRDLEKSAESIRSFSKADAEKWRLFSERMARLASVLEALYAIRPPRITTTDAGELLRLLGVGRKLRGLGKVDMVEFIRALPISVDEWLNDWFECDVLQGALAAGGVTHLRQGPRSGGTTLVLMHHAVGKPAGALRARSIVRGGIGNLATALSAAAQDYGATIRLGADVAHIAVKNGRATGVVLKSGEEIEARRVVSSADVRRTFVDWLDPLQLDPEFLRTVRNIRFRGARAKINLALAGLPAFAGADESHLRGLISISPSLAYLERAYDDAKHGGVSRRPYLEVAIPSLADPTLAPAGKHVMSIWMQYAPYTLKEGAWDDTRREALGDAVVETLAEYAPDLKSLILQRQVLTPLDLENAFGLSEGQLYGGELALDQFLFMRPVAGWAQYRTPIDGLYLCGATTHPGGGLAGASGRNAAHEILKDRGIHH